MPYLELKTAKIYYETWGETGRWITLLNGYSRTLDDFRPMGRFLVERGFRVLSLDNRGAGRTVSDVFGMKDSIVDVAALWRHLKIESSGLLGISYGGGLALGVALAYPESVHRLMLVSTSAVLSRVNRVDSPDPEALKKFFSEKFIATHEILVKALIKEMAKAFSDPDKVKNTQGQRAAMGDYDFSKQLEQIKFPVMILHGSEDHIVEVSSARHLKESIPSATLEILPGVGHLLLAEAPKRLYAATADFF